MIKIKEVFNLLKKNELRVSTAESFTGGGIASRIVSIAGASDIFSLSLICYSNQAKMQLLGVSSETLTTYGAVSAQTVSEMLDGLEKIGQADVVVATSGNAGPTAEKDDEVGVYYIGVMHNDKKLIRRYHHIGSRKQVIDNGISDSLDLIAEILR